VEAIHAETRTNDKGNSNNELRRTGWVPAVIYGAEVNNLPIKVKARDLEHALRKQTTNKPFTLKIHGTDYNVMVYELQRHPVTGNILHADFKQINMNERIHTTVPILLSGDPELGVATLVRHSLEVSCLPTNIPESFTVNVDGLTIGDVILVKDLPIPEGVESGLDEMEVVVSVLPVKDRSDESEEAQKEAEGTAEAAEAPVAEAKKG
jgi:large subunit ribosomal protein L25